MILVDHEILEAIKVKAAFIEPFNEKQLNNCSYDLTLDNHFISNRYSQHQSKIDFNHVSQSFKVEENYKGPYRLGPGDRVLGCTREFAGSTGSGFRESTRFPGRQTAIQTYIQATSTVGRIGLTACLCAGWGDVGYFNKWTLEINNLSPRSIYLERGMVICQLVFEEVEMPNSIYGKDCGSYQSSLDIEKVKSEWSPMKNMMPKKIKVYE